MFPESRKHMFPESDSTQDLNFCYFATFCVMMFWVTSVSFNMLFYAVGKIFMSEFLQMLKKIIKQLLKIQRW